MVRLLAIGLLGALAVASCTDDVPSETTTDTCTDPPCEQECSDPPCEQECFAPPCDEECTDPPCDDPGEDPAFVHVPITIVDPIVNGTSLVVPVDGVSFAQNGQGTFVTAFGRDVDDPSQTFLWEIDEAAGTHQKLPLTGQVFAQGSNFCFDEEWCQLIGYDGGAWVVVGPAAGDMMRVTAGTAALATVTGPRAAASFINHSHRFAAGELFLHGATGPSGFSDSLHVLTLSSGVWRQAATGLPQIHDNCLAFDTTSNTLYSVAGRTTNDGGETSQAVATMTVVDVTGGTHALLDLPAGIGARSQMSCTFDAQRGLLFAFGGAVINDRFNDALNEFFNDLWVYEVATDSWTNVIANTVGGKLGEPDGDGDQRYEGEPGGPNFGRSRGLLQLDETADRLLLIGAVPVFTHEQLYVLPLAEIDSLVD